jgi:UDP-N-acetyl-D-mannosaminuronate dehydrogenase
LEAMQQLKAVVKNGRLVIDEPTELPEGTELMLTVVDEADGMDDAERARLHESLRRSIAQAKAGQLVDGDEVIGKLLARR